ncbi:hypothetical protein H6504_03870 [Candidatus Woesearchaeota archaeon]|nr:hypothetical protein [Candidatus Woesearchaeota archaeon]
MRKVFQDAKANGYIKAFTLNITHEERRNLYFERDLKPESILHAKNKKINATIFKDTESGLGEYSFSLRPDATEEDIKQELKSAIDLISTSVSKPYNLPDDKNTDDSDIDYNLFSNAYLIEDIKSGNVDDLVTTQTGVLREMLHGKPIICNALEFFSKSVTITLQTSYCKDKTYITTSCYMEFVLTWQSEQGETEHIVYEKIDKPETFDFKACFREAILSVEDTNRAAKAVDYDGPVLLCGAANYNFWKPDLTMNAVIAHCSARLSYLGVSSYKIGEPAVHSENDRLTIFTNPLLPENSSSGPFDQQGVTSRRICLLEESRCAAFFASKQYAEYLNTEATGGFGVIEILPGTAPITRPERHIEIVSFASFVPDQVSGDFSAEIRLGYIVEGKNRKPFKGGLFSGNIFELAKHLHLNDKVIEKPGYMGPDMVLFDNGNIVGL